MALPDDIVTEIFSYLPAKSAGRFRSLSRSWRTALSSTSFVHLHLRRANKPGEHKVFFSPPYNDDDAEEESNNDDAAEEEPNDDGDASEQEQNEDDSTLGEEPNDVSTPEPGEEEPHNYNDDDDTLEEEESHNYDDDDDDDETREEESYFYAWQPGGVAARLSPNSIGLLTPLARPLHGLVLMSKCRYYICNPCTGAALVLPDTCKPQAKMIWRPSGRHVVRLPWYRYVAYGFGYCSVTGEYKVVRLFSKVVHDDDEYSPVLCEVFVLDTLAYWRPAAQQPPACIVEEKDPGVFLDGRLHFLCRDGGILSFDVSTETFGSVLLPPNLEDAPTKMTELDGCLCICHGDIGFGDSPYHIWVLRNYKQGKWERLCRVDPTTWTEPERAQLECSWIAPLGFYNGENGHKKIMFHTGTFKVFAVDVPKGNTPEVIFNPEETIGSSFEDFDEPGLGLFEESLVHVGCTIEEMVLSSPHTKVWFNILKWMPTRYVANLSLVCRAWRAMIKDDHFIRSHATHANLNKSPRIMIVKDSVFGEYVDLQDIIDQRRGTQDATYLVCSQPCHGLNAGTFHFRSFVCNPVKGYFENIELDVVDDDTFFAGQTGLGYDSKNKIHVLLFVIYKVKNLATREYKLDCKLRYVDDPECRSLDPPPTPVADVPPAYVEGKIFWLVEPNLGSVSLNCEIVAFDIGTEEFEVLQGPPCSHHDNGRMSILRLQGAICVSCSDKSSNVIDMWMMKDVGIWSMEYQIELEEFSSEYSSERTTILAIDPTDGRILLSTGQSLGYYDPKTAAMETLFSQFYVQWPDYKFCPVICDESFVSTLCDERFI